METALLITRNRPLFHKLSREQVPGTQLTYTDSLESAEGLCELRPVSTLIIDSDTIPIESYSFFENCRDSMPDVRIVVLHSAELTVDISNSLEDLDVIPVQQPATLKAILTQEPVYLAEAVIEEEIEYVPERAKSDEELLFDLMGGSASMEKIARLVMKVAPSSATILLGGENGTGKEYFATIIHKLSKLEGKFVPVNCGAIPETLFESELFGHKKGSFTGADRDRVGLVEEADGGTLFLDEVGELSLSMQVKLLRFLQEDKYKPVGESSEKSAKCRIISATNRDLKKMVAKGTFREDLFYRLHVFPLTLPPLRDRREMIPRLLELFLHNQSKKHNKKITGFTPEAEFLLSRHQFPGNIRELQNIVEYATILAVPPKITVSDLPEYLQVLPGITDQRPLSLGIDFKPEPVDEESEQGLAPDIVSTTIAEHREGFFVGEKLSLQDLEERYMRYILEQCDNNHSEAAKILGVSRSTLWRKLKEEN